MVYVLNVNYNGEGYIYNNMNNYDYDKLIV